MSTTAESELPRWIESLSGRRGVVLAGLWGLAEGTFFFVVPDVLFTLVAGFWPARALAHVGAATAGALVGGALLFTWSAGDAAGARTAVGHVPWGGAQMVEAPEARLAAEGTRPLFDRPLGGVPYKVHAVLAPEHFSLGRFLALSALARLERFGISWSASALLGWTLGRRLSERRRLLLVLHALAWSAIYVYYWFL